MGAEIEIPTSKDGLPPLPSFTKTAHSQPYPFISPTRPELSASGKNVVITGGGTGIGKAIALAFAQAGAKSIAIFGRRLDRLQSAAAEISKAGPNTSVLYESADMTDATIVDKAFGSIVGKVGKIDIFVSCAGGLAALGPVIGSDGAQLMKSFEINVLTTFNGLQAFVKSASTDAVLLNITSNLGHVGPWPGMFGYSVSKAANIKMLDYFAAENPAIRVVNVHPGLVKTELNEDLGVPEVDSPHLCGHFCVWLATPEAAFLKGKLVWANWDAEELIAKAEEINNTRVLTCYLDGLPF